MGRTFVAIMFVILLAPGLANSDPPPDFVRVLRERQPAFTWCYRRAILAQPPVIGPILEARFTIARSGHAVNVRVTSSPASPPLETCIADALRRTTFGPVPSPIAVVLPMQGNVIP